jgi:hypothetical protein
MFLRYVGTEILVASDYGPINTMICVCVIEICQSVPISFPEFVFLTVWLNFATASFLCLSFSLSVRMKQIEN